MVSPSAESHPPARTIHFVSLGCAKNRVDTEVMVGVGEQTGWRVVTDPTEAEVIVVNTCGFIGPAKEESIDTVLELARLKAEGRCRKLVMAGCLAQRYARHLAVEMPEVDHFLGSSDPMRLREVLNEPAPERLLVGRPEDWLVAADSPRRRTQWPHVAYVKIAEGCNRSCAFCAIPAIRGKQRSRPLSDIRREVERLVAEEDVREVVLVSQDTIAWGRDLPERPALAELVASLAEVPGLRWLRLHYLYPERLDPRLLELMADHPVVLPYVDVPLQHVADSVLRRMRRGHGGERIRRFVAALKEAVPKMVLRTTFLVGHPGEDASAFEELRDFLRWARFDHVGFFVYSPEEGTAAATMDGAPTPQEARRRRRELLRVQAEVVREKQRALLGQQLQVQVDGPSPEVPYLWEGRWWGQAPEVDGKVFLARGPEARRELSVGELVAARITRCAGSDLLAQVCEPSVRPTASEGHASEEPSSA